MVLIGLFVWIETRVAQPLIDMAVLRKPAVAFTNLTGFLVGIAMFSSFLVFPQFAQAPESTGYGFGFSVTAAGFLLLPTALAQLAAGPPAAKLGERIGFRGVLTIGAVLITLSFLINTFAHDHPWELIIGGMLLGVGITFGFAAMANLIVDAVPAVRGRHRDRHQHRHADRRRLLRRRDRDRDPHLHDGPGAQRRPLHGRVRVLGRGRVHRDHGLVADPASAPRLQAALATD